MEKYIVAVNRETQYPHIHIAVMFADFTGIWVQALVVVSCLLINRRERVSGFLCCCLSFVLFNVRLSAYVISASVGYRSSRA